MTIAAAAGSAFAYHEVRETRAEIAAAGTLLHLNDIKAAVVTSQFASTDPQFGLRSKEMRLVYEDGSYFVTDDRRIIVHVLSKLAPGKAEFHTEKL
jgi:hypothetical protein